MHINTLRPAPSMARQLRPTLPSSLLWCVSPDRLTTSRACCADVLPSGLLPLCFRLPFSFASATAFTSPTSTAFRLATASKVALSSLRASHFSCSALALCCSTTFPWDRGLVSSRTSLSRSLRPGYLHLLTDPRGFYTQ